MLSDQRPLTLRSAIKTLVVLALGLPVAVIVLVWFRGLLVSMGDASGAEIIGHVGTACQAVWAISVVGLVILLAITQLNERPPE